MQIKFEGSLTKEEFKNAAKLMNHSISKKKSFDTSSWIWLVLIGAGLIAVSMRALFFEQNIGAGVLFGAIGAVVFSYGMKTRTIIDRAWEENAKNNPTLEGIITDEYVETRGPDGISQVFWTAFSGYCEVERVVLLIRGSVGYPFSARFFQSEVDWQKFREFVASKLTITHKMEKKVSLSTILLIGWILLSILLVILVLRSGAK